MCLICTTTLGQNAEILNNNNVMFYSLKETIIVFVARTVCVPKTTFAFSSNQISNKAKTAS